MEEKQWPRTIQLPLPPIAITLCKFSRTYVPPGRKGKDGKNEC